MMRAKEVKSPLKRNYKPDEPNNHSQSDSQSRYNQGGDWGRSKTIAKRPATTTTQASSYNKVVRSELYTLGGIHLKDKSLSRCSTPKKEEDIIIVAAFKRSSDASFSINSRKPKTKREDSDFFPDKFVTCRVRDKSHEHRQFTKEKLS